MVGKHIRHEAAVVRQGCLPVQRHRDGKRHFFIHPLILDADKAVFIIFFCDLAGLVKNFGS